MSLRFHGARKIAACIIAIPLAVLSGAHALSSASVRNSPELAATIWPANGIALETLAYRAFVEDIRSTLKTPGDEGGADDLSGEEVNKQISVGRGDLQKFAVSATSAAREALKSEPLSPKAHAILALSEQNPSRQRRLVELASSLNRRDLALQGLVLQSKIDSQDYVATMETLDQILRVYPQRRAEFYPYLTAALSKEATIPAFRKLLADPLPWRDSFIMHALGDPAATRNLVVIRQQVDFDNPEFDRALIATLARNGEIAAAAAQYRKLSMPTSSGSRSDWATDFPPFDWQLAQDAGIRAQVRTDNRELEFAIDPGNGGVFAARLITLPKTAFTIVVPHKLSSPTLAKDLKLLLSCSDQATPFFEANFADTRGRFIVERRPDCEYVNLAIAGRAWTGEEPLNGSLGNVVIAER